ncbi:acetyl-CoA carboxylase carboxyltransferase subunit beta [Rhodospirillaceae bacterium KN72]|uniref:Acetyl-coenzyme A carboxylase carboxyl transferase subunit beta n=1 Tax=Pacificispira spongiicola TaxID=2729598 RepID=A0A7Y0E0I2_9PROT|nr:acetyl-CoA carboxylase, carboxyltransferase subunit beta [Pacificispira spongiicola]NMM44985.1 acetyl-CoA carboxylase carboxyltransferase subunit beta [Pacificispira spongiicola]
MNWLTNWVRPKIKALVGEADVPDNLWHKCPSCGQMIFHRDLDAHINVCQHCGHHLRIPLAKRFEHLFDDGVYTKIELPRVKIDPLKFRDKKRYTDRLKEAQAKTDTGDAIVVAHGKIKGKPVVIAAFNFQFMGGSMGMAVGEGMLAASRLAVMQKAPLIAIPSSGGARMQEGILSLMQMPRTTIAVEEVKEAGLPYIVLMTDPTTGGVSASFAMLGDIHIAEPGAQIGFAGRRVIEQTVRETLPEGFQTAEYLLEHGMIDLVVPRSEQRETLANLIGLLMDGVKAIAPPPAQKAKDAAADLDIPTPEKPSTDGDKDAKADTKPAAKSDENSGEKSGAKSGAAPTE